MILFTISIKSYHIHTNCTVSIDRPCGLMDKASDFESEDCEFESRRGRCFETRFPHKITRKDVPFWENVVSNDDIL